MLKRRILTKFLPAFVIVVFVSIQIYDVINTFTTKAITPRAPKILHTVVMKGVPERRKPKAIIVGVAKCGTDTLLRFIEKHPLIKAPLREIKFFNNIDEYERGLPYYVNQMPESFENQITIEKSPQYFEGLTLQKEYMILIKK